MTKRTHSPKRRRRARPLLVAVGALVLGGCDTQVHGVVANHCAATDTCPTGEDNDLSAPDELPDMATTDLKQAQD